MAISSISDKNNKNTNVFKKLIPIIDKYRDDLIITTDDDILYPKDLIENVIQWNTTQNM